MSSIWITLLDTSGSMNDGFTASQGQTPDPLAEHGAWATKIEAAKELLLKQIATIRVQDISVFQFKDAPGKLFQGTRDQLLAQPQLVRSLTAGGGTSIANALAAVEDDPSFEPYQSLNVLVVSDGLSDLEAAKRAADSLLLKYPFARIDTILIDDTDEGRAVAETISINGSFRPVTSSTQLRAALSGARIASLQSNLANLALFRLNAQLELARFDQQLEPTLISVTSGQRLTAQSIREDIVPTLAGIEALGQASSYLARTEYRGTVSSISQDSPISINLTGLKDAVELALTYIIPWRRKNAERLAALELEKREVELERDKRGLAMHNYDEEQRRLELLRMGLELAHSKLDLAEKMLKTIDPESRLRGEARERALGRLLSGVEHMAATRLEFRVVSDARPQ